LVTDLSFLKMVNPLILSADATSPFACPDIFGEGAQGDGLVAISPPFNNKYIFTVNPYKINRFTLRNPTLFLILM
jgi:hypothetical protein